MVSMTMDWSVHFGLPHLTRSQNRTYAMESRKKRYDGSTKDNVTHTTLPSAA